MTIRIVALAERPGLVPTVGRWHRELWGSEDPDGSLESWTARVNRWANLDAVPMIFVALRNEQAVGSVSLVVHDLPDRSELWDLLPWLSGLFVLPQYRGAGVGRALVAGVEEQARSLGIERLYLYTAHARDFYKQLDWDAMRTDAQDGVPITIMTKRVSAPVVARSAG